MPAYPARRPDSRWRSRRVAAVRALARSVVGALLLSLGLAAIAGAQQPTVDEADVYVSRAIVAYEEKNYQAALAALREALEIAPNHVDALFYTGLTLVALGRTAEAVEPLEKARALAPKDEAILFQLGAVYLALEKFDQARPLLETAFAAKPRLDGLGYYVGFLRYRRNDFRGALKAFDEGVATDLDVQQLTRFYKALSYRALGLPERAASELEEALRVRPESPLATPADRVREALTAARQSERRFWAEVRLGAVYDDNVPIIPGVSIDPGIQSLQLQKRSSFGGVGSVRLDYTFLRAGSFDASVNYAFFGVLYDDLPRFNLIDNLGGLTANYRGQVAGYPYYSTLQYSYDYSLLGDKPYAERHIATEYLSLAENPWNLTTLQLRYTHRYFYTDPSGTPDDRRSGPNYMGGLTHLFRFAQDKHLLRVGYQFDWEDTVGRNFVYRGNRLLTGAQYTLPWGGVRVNFDFDVHFRYYPNPNSEQPTDAPNTVKRMDTEFNYLFGITVPIGRGFSVAAQYARTVNQSNLDLYAYTRNIAYVFMLWSY